MAHPVLRGQSANATPIRYAQRSTVTQVSHPLLLHRKHLSLKFALSLDSVLLISSPARMARALSRIMPRGIDAAVTVPVARCSRMARFASRRFSTQRVLMLPDA